MSDAINALVSERFRELRRKGGPAKQRMTQAEFAELTGVNKATIVNIENRRQGATLAVVYRIADAIGIDVAELLPGVAEVRRASQAVTGEGRIETGLPEWAELIEQSTGVWDGGEEA